MFSKLYNKIYLQVMAIAVLFILMILSISYVIIADNIYDLIRSRINIAVETQKENFNITIDSIFNFAHTTAKKQSVVVSTNTISDTGNNIYGVSTLASDLLALRNSNGYITAVTLYDLEGNATYTENIGSVPSLAELMSDSSLDRFFNQDTTEFLSVRTTTIAKTYNYSVYDSSNGIISCCVKVSDVDGRLCGFIFVDMLPNKIMKELLSFTGYNGMTNSAALICGDSTIYYGSSSYLDKILERDNAFAVDIPDVTIKQSFDLTSDYSVVTVVSVNESVVDMLIVLVIFVVVTVVATLIVRHFAVKLATSITQPLDRLLLRMRNFSFDEGHNDHMDNS